MQDTQCVQFLQRALPRLHLCWAGFRKVRKQVCKRIQRRIDELRLDGIDAYQIYLDHNESEWSILDVQCRITISRFYRDRDMWEYLSQNVLPELIQKTINKGETTIRAWSAGCAAGEEAYSLALMWQQLFAKDCRQIRLEIIATDIDKALLDRARRGCYPYSSVKAIPKEWLHDVFIQKDNLYCLKNEFLHDIKLNRQDIRVQIPPGSFHLIFCRNLVFTYFDTSLQRQVLDTITENMVQGGALILGGHESLPENVKEFQPWHKQRMIYRFNRT